MTSPAQRQMLFGLLKKLASARGWGSAQTNVERLTITEDLFGSLISWNDLDDSQIDRLKSRLQALARPPAIAAEHGDIDEAADSAATEDGERRRLVHRIEQDLRKADLKEGYIRKIALDQFDRADWRDLPIPKLTMLRDIIATRIWARRRKARAAAANGEGGQPARREGQPARRRHQFGGAEPEPHPF